MIEPPVDLSRFFDEDLFSFDLVKGVATNPARNRICVLSTDMLRGIHNAVVEESGEASPLVFKKCGHLWGKRLMTRLNAECELFSSPHLSSMPVSDFLTFLSDYMLFQGWGKLTFDLSESKSRGIIQVQLEHSILCEVMHDSNQRVHPLICGILSGIFSALSAQDLDCLETECLQTGHTANRFVITARERLEPFDRVIGTVDHIEVMKNL
ncbi:MAG: V4R domain-containing protein [Verrucomicrobiota bacterium]|nr:V4R domain-containing protein [Verrucomicrobiota bacterium]